MAALWAQVIFFASEILGHFQFSHRISMTREELKEFLKEHLKIELYTHRESYRSYLGVTIKIDEEEIDSSVCYDIEL